MYHMRIFNGSVALVLKMHERVYVNDPEMQMGDGSAAQFEDYVESIRGSSVPSQKQKRQWRVRM